MAEVRLIDANALIEEICKDCNAIKDGLCEYDICASVQWVSEAPTIDPDSLRPKGRWIDRPSVKGQVYCSECATIEKVTDSNYKSRSCPNCGADMREEKT